MKQQNRRAVIQTSDFNLKKDFFFKEFCSVLSVVKVNPDAAQDQSEIHSAPF